MKTQKEKKKVIGNNDTLNSNEIKSSACCGPTCCGNSNKINKLKGKDK